MYGGNTDNPEQYARKQVRLAEGARVRDEANPDRKNDETKQQELAGQFEDRSMLNHMADEEH